MRPKALVVGGLLGLGFWVGVFAAIREWGAWRVVEGFLGAALFVAFLILCRDAVRAARPSAEPVAPENDYALRERYNRAQRERRAS